MPHSSHVEWAGASWRLRVYEITARDGSVVEKGFVEHPGAVVILPLLQTGEVLMLRQYRASLQETILELPAGTRGWEEDWLDCAQRELREETGYRAQSLVEMGDVWPAPGYSDELLRYYVARDLEHDPLMADADEQIALQPVALGVLEAMALDGRLRDAKSVVGVLRLNQRLRGSL
jgi:ADP-ribose pyrophosphatase